jgi:hypothetical protein
MSGMDPVLFTGSVAVDIRYCIYYGYVAKPPRLKVYINIDAFLRYYNSSKSFQWTKLYICGAGAVKQRLNE